MDSSHESMCHSAQARAENAEKALAEALAVLRRWREAGRLEDADVYDQAAEAADALLAKQKGE